MGRPYPPHRGSGVLSSRHTNISSHRPRGDVSRSMGSGYSCPSASQAAEAWRTTVHLLCAPKAGALCASAPRGQLVSPRETSPLRPWDEMFVCREGPPLQPNTTAPGISFVRAVKKPPMPFVCRLGPRDVGAPGAEVWARTAMSADMEWPVAHDAYWITSFILAVRPSRLRGSWTSKAMSGGPPRPPRSRMSAAGHRSSTRAVRPRPRRGST